MAILAFWREILIALLLAYGLWQRGERIDAQGQYKLQVTATKILGDKIGEYNTATAALEAAAAQARAAGKAAKAKADKEAAAAEGQIAALKLQIASPTPAGATATDAIALVRKSLAPATRP